MDTYVSIGNRLVRITEHDMEDKITHKVEKFKLDLYNEVEYRVEFTHYEEDEGGVYLYFNENLVLHVYKQLMLTEMILNGDIDENLYFK